MFRYAEQNINYGENYGEIYYNGPTTNEVVEGMPFVRVVKRRSTANKKERRRTQSINSAFAYLRDRIPNVPSDTKLSKVRNFVHNFAMQRFSWRWLNDVCE